MDFRIPKELLEIVVLGKRSVEFRHLWKVLTVSVFAEEYDGGIGVFWMTMGSSTRSILALDLCTYSHPAP